MESDACTQFSVIPLAYFFLIVPSFCSFGFVAPFISLTLLIQSFPSNINAHNGLRVIN